MGVLGDSANVVIEWYRGKSAAVAIPATIVGLIAAPWLIKQCGQAGEALSDEMPSIAAPLTTLVDAFPESDDDGEFKIIAAVEPGKPYDGECTLYASALTFDGAWEIDGRDGALDQTLEDDDQIVVRFNASGLVDGSCIADLVGKGSIESLVKTPTRSNQRYRPVVAKPSRKARACQFKAPAKIRGYNEVGLELDSEDPNKPDMYIPIQGGVYALLEGDQLGSTCTARALVPEDKFSYVKPKK